MLYKFRACLMIVLITRLSRISSLHTTTMPFGSQASLDFFDTLPPIDSTRSTAGQSLFEGMEALKSSRMLYKLCLVDEEGRPLTIPSEQDLQAILEKPKAAPAPPPQPEAASTSQQQLEQQPKEPSFQELLAESHSRGGPVCSHCHAT
jgi:hypothetical protein